jgi:thiol:disulfide interchange protein
MTKLLLIAMATVEVSTGVTLLAAPYFVVWLLLGEELNSPRSLVLGLMMGAALLSISVACWRERNRKPNQGGGIFGSMVLYNLLVPRS